MTNYIFPELTCYKRDWIPLLEAARELVRHSAVRYVCNALYAVAHSSNASEKFSTQAAELSDYIEQSLGGFHTVSEWFSREPSRRRVPRHRLPTCLDRPHDCGV